MNWYFVILCLLIIALFGRYIYLRARQLHQRIEEFHKEQEENPIDPYSALSELYTLQEQSQKQKRR